MGIIIAVSPNPLSFGKAPKGTTKFLNFTVSNSADSTADLHITVGAPSSPFALELEGSTDITLIPGHSFSVPLSFTPSSLGDFTGSLNIAHDATSESSPLVLDLAGTGWYPFGKSYKTASGDVLAIIDGTGLDLMDCDLKKIDRLSVGFDDADELVFFPSKIKLQFRDPSKALYDYMRANTPNVSVQLNGDPFYYGIPDVMQVTRIEKTRESEFVAFDASNQLKNIKIKDSIGSDLNPLGYIDGVYVATRQLILDIFKQINPDVTLHVNQDWAFKLRAPLDDPTYTFDQTLLKTNPLFFGTKPFDTLADLLKNLAQNFGCSAGMFDRNNAYFVKRWKSSASPISLDMTGTTRRVKQFKRSTWLAQLNAVRVNEKGPFTDTYTEGDWDALPSGEPRYPDKTLQVDLWWGTSNTSTNISIFDGEAVRNLATIQDLAVDSTFRNVRETVAKYLYNYRSIARQKYESTLYGLDYSILNLYSYGAITLRPSKLDYDLSKHETQMTAVDIS
jgi:hypothetical protein